MRVGLIADIHGNLVALEAVLAALARERVERIVCLGDVAVLGPQPEAVFARLRALGIPCVLGNTDAWLVDEHAHDRTDPARATMVALTDWCTAQLGAADVAFLRACPPTLRLALDAGRELLCCHGSPRSFDDVIAATTPDEALTAMLAGERAAVIVGGHTHVQLLRRHDAMLIVNVGSVGLPGTGPGTPDLPINRAVRWAEYGVVEAHEGGLEVALHRVPLDLRAVLAAGRASGMPQFAWWRDRWDR